MVLTMVNVVYLMVWLFCKKQFVWEIDWRKQNTIWAGIIICFLHCISGNSSNGEPTAVRAIDELIMGRAEKFAAAFDERIALLENTPTDQILHVRWLPEPEWLKFDDGKGDMSNWRNSS